MDSTQMEVKGDIIDDEESFISNDIEASPASRMNEPTSIGKEYISTPIEEEQAEEDADQDDLSRV